MLKVVLHSESCSLQTGSEVDDQPRLAQGLNRDLNPLLLPELLQGRRCIPCSWDVERARAWWCLESVWCFKSLLLAGSSLKG